jgi:cyclophilin family peptidyl-prolyl cis-trans isomerase
MPRPQTQRERARAREQARTTAQQQQAAADRRRRRTLALVGFVLILALLAGVAGSVIGGNDDETVAAGSTTTTTGDPSTTTIPAVGNAELPVPAPGEVLTEPTPCPAEDGSSPRVTTFAGPPPMCIEANRFYEATLVTSKGDLKIQLNPEQAPNAVNNFVVLARYHYYDGQPFTAIFPREAAVVRGTFDNPEGIESPGYTIPGEAPPQGQIFVPGTIAFIPLSEADAAYAASFLLATFERAADLPQNVTSFGIMLDGQDALIGIDRAGSQQGTPVEAVVIESIAIRASAPIG